MPRPTPKPKPEPNPNQVEDLGDQACAAPRGGGEPGAGQLVATPTAETMAALHLVRG